MRNEGRAGQVAAVLRERVLTGELQPGQRLSEEQVRESVGVGRSTLREAFQLLIRERLLSHHLSRGVFVRTLTKADVADLFEARRVIEIGALQRVSSLSAERLRAVRTAVRDGRDGERAEDWQGVAGASVRFHQALVGLAGSPRLDELIEGLMAEFRLAYARMDDTQQFHRGFLDRNEALADLIGAGEIGSAVIELEKYLHDSERALVAAYR